MYQVSHEIYETVEKKFEDFGQKAVGAIIFLRYICPLITVPPETLIHPGTFI